MHDILFVVECKSRYLCMQKVHRKYFSAWLYIVLKKLLEPSSLCYIWNGKPRNNRISNQQTTETIQFLSVVPIQWVYKAPLCITLRLAAYFAPSTPPIKFQQPLKIIHPKYSTLTIYCTVAHTIDCMCSKILLFKFFEWKSILN